ncbi:hypothetical protein FRC01_006646, partial [Tulasnella sp. 417]
GTEFLSKTLGLSLPALTECSLKFGWGANWSWDALRIAHMPHLRQLDIHWVTQKPPASNRTIPLMSQLLDLRIFATHPGVFESAAPHLAAATPNVEQVSLTQLNLRPDVHDYDVPWFPLLSDPNQDPLKIVWPRLVALRLCGARVATRPPDDLKRIALGRPAFKLLSVDRTCWGRMIEAGQDVDALRGCFDVVVTDDAA